MPEPNGKEYKNPAYKCDYEEAGQQNHDTRSASSTSSVKRFLNMKLKTGGRARWILLIVVIVVLVLVIAAICATVIVVNSENEEHSLQNVQADDKNVASSTTSTVNAITSPRSEGPGTWRPKTTPRTTTQRPADTTTPFVDLSTPKNLSAHISDIDFYPGAKTLTISCQAFHEGNLKSVDLRGQFKDGYEPLATILVSPDSDTMVLVFPNNVTYRKIERKYEMLLRVTFDPFDCGHLTNFSCAATTEEKTESAIARITKHSLQNVQADDKNVASSTTSTVNAITSPRSEGPGTWRPKTTPRTTTQRPADTTTPFVDLSTPKNLSAHISDIDFYPGAKTLTISCQAFHEGNLKSVDLRRQFKDGYEPLATILVSPDSDTMVLVFPNNVTYRKIERKYEMLLRVTFDPFDCGHLTNFSCAATTEEKTESAIARITINNEPPLMEIPHSVIENKNISLECGVTLWGNESSLVWKFKPETSDTFMTFNVAPVNNITYDDCITTITTTLTFAPTMYEHGAEFRCQIEPRESDVRILRDSDYAGVNLKVVPKTFCDDKRQFTINKHPYEPCSLVVYCLSTGPLVYEIECDPGECYDAQTTKCVDEALVRSGTPIPPETVSAPRSGSAIPPETVPAPSVG